ncbi:MAG: hypothetical protein JNM17_34265 [Archangium sp.]|nr:hypothetical protein [Archangium sp.]
MLTTLALMLLMTPDYMPRTVTDPSGRYLGFKQVGKDPYNYHSLEFTLTSAKTATVKMLWLRRDQSDVQEKRELQLEDVKVDANGMTAKVKGDRPAEVPAVLKGKFVNKGPGANAKGRVVPGILFDGDWFLELHGAEVE